MSHAGTRRAFWTTAACYALVAFEFFYMATPFAAYFYAAYRPGLTLFDRVPWLSVLGRTFLPHIAVSTNNPVLDAHDMVGAVLAIAGFLGFCVAAGQVYYTKLARKGVVLGGVYRLVRHPQYTCLAVCGLGMLLLWPRYIVLVTFVAMLFAYAFLARAEERECLASFGEPYREYLRRTHAFVPFRLPRPSPASRWRPAARGQMERQPFDEAAPAAEGAPRRRGPARVGIAVARFALAVGLAIGVALAVNEVALRSLSARYTDNTVYLSVTRMSADRLDRITALADADPNTRAALAAAGPGASLISYVLPVDWDISETLMRPRPGGERLIGSDYHGSRYRVVYTKAKLRRPAHGRGILTSATTRRPLLEVIVDLEDADRAERTGDSGTSAPAGRVIEVLPPDPDPRYAGVPVPVY